MFYLFFVNQFGENAKVDGANWNAYAMISMTIFGVIGSAINTMANFLANERKTGWIRWLKTTPLHPGVYLIAKVMNQLLLNLTIIIIIYLVGALFGHVDLPLKSWIFSGLLIWFGSLPFMALGLMIGILAGVEATYGIATGIYFILSFFGGLWTPMTFLPNWVKKVSEWIPTYHLGKLGWSFTMMKAPEWFDAFVLFSYFVIFLIIDIIILVKQEEGTV
jgi:ABC-2 type transport system permease protein